MSTNEIYQYNSPKEILIQLFQRKKDRNANYSLRAWSKKLGFHNPSFLSEILRGKKTLSTKIAHKIAPRLDISEQERRYFESLVYLQHAKTEEEKSYYASVVAQYLPEKKVKVNLNHEKWEGRSWLYWILDEMLSLKDFKNDARFLAKRIDPNLTSHFVQDELDYVQKIGMILKDKNGKLYRTGKTSNRGKMSVPVRLGVRENLFKPIYNKLLTYPFDQENPDQYKIHMNPMPMKERDIPRFFKAIDTFLNDSYQYESEEDADHIYVLTAGFFKLTQDV